MSGADRTGADPYAPISTHVLDTVAGRPAPDVPVRLDRLAEPGPDPLEPAQWSPVAAGRTDGDGRLRQWVPQAAWAAGRYRLVFDLTAHLGPDAFYPEVVVSFRVHDPVAHHHLPVLLSPFGYTTYRGS